LISGSFTQLITNKNTDPFVMIFLIIFKQNLKEKMKEEILHHIKKKVCGWNILLETLMALGLLNP